MDQDIPLDDVDPPTTCLKTGNRAKAIKKSIDHENNIAACQNCKYFARAHTALFNSMPVRFFAQCKKFKIQTGPMSLCSNWTGKNGDKLQLD